MSNIGEKDERLIKLYLIYLRDKEVICLPHIGVIESVGFGNKEYSKWPQNIELENLKQYSINNWQKIEILCDQLGVNKSPSGAKSDVYINNIGISLKSLNGAPPALINHTHRAGFIKVANRLGEDIHKLDSLIDEYWKLRLKGIIAEDVFAEGLNSPFGSQDAKKIIKPYLKYFLFEGTAKNDSKYPAEYLLDFSDIFELSSWHIYNKEDAVSDKIYSRLKFSLRSKGMEKYPNIKNKEDIEPWTKLCDNKYKGALHVRFC